MAKALNDAELSNASGGQLRNASAAEEDCYGKGAVVVEGFSKKIGEFVRMGFSEEKLGKDFMKKAIEFAKEADISTDVDLKQGENNGSDTLKDYYK